MIPVQLANYLILSGCLSFSVKPAVQGGESNCWIFLIITYDTPEFNIMYYIYSLGVIFHMHGSIICIAHNQNAKGILQLMN